MPVMDHSISVVRKAGFGIRLFLSELKPFSAAWFREHMQSFMDKAIDEPTNENVRAYLYLQRVMMDKGSQFADVSPGKRPAITP